MVSMQKLNWGNEGMGSTVLWDVLPKAHFSLIKLPHPMQAGI